MFWEKLGNFFALEAIPAWIGLVASWIYFAYQSKKSKRGRHIVCSQPEPVFSHLYLSDTAREWVEVKFVGGDQPNPMKVSTLSQVLIDIKNESDEDVLNDIMLKFRVPDARLLGMWWEKAPPYLVKDARVDFLHEDDSLIEAGEALAPPLRVQVSLPHLKSFKKYKEVFRLGIIADGDLETIKMLPAGSRGQVAPDQTWTARFLPYREYQRRANRSRILGIFLPTVIISTLFVGFVVRLIVLLIGEPSELNQALLVGMVSGGMFLWYVTFSCLLFRLTIAGIDIRRMLGWPPD